MIAEVENQYRVLDALGLMNNDRKKKRSKV
jgi:hypothetical protein